LLLNGSHLQRALRHFELNPVRAELASAPWDWPWSSAYAHTLDHVMDPFLDCRWAEYFRGWNYGEPLGSREFITTLERQAGRRLRVLARGRPPKQSEAADPASLQEGLFAG
jgi:hypothetical protein